VRFIILALVMVITGCTTTSRTGPETTTGEAVTDWHIKGRLAARVDQRGETVSFIWQRQRENHSIELYGPLGSGRVFLKQQDGAASLVDNSTEFFGDSLEDVLFQRSGWLVPFDQLQQWVIGQPQLDEITDVVYESSRLTGFSQSGWQVSYDKFRQYSNLSIPTRITLTASASYISHLAESTGRQIANAKVKIIIATFSSK
jgi:outer membrane lipoprotein LolB